MEGRNNSRVIGKLVVIVKCIKKFNTKLENDHLF